jgi:DNA-binding transcriptional MerR regulator
MFLAGGMVLSQVANVTGLEPYTVQNWVKRGFLAPPKNKRYSMEQVCRIININMLKSVLPMERICGLLGYINGQLDDNSDDIIKDSDLYFIFVKLAARARELDNMQQRDVVIDQIMADYQESVPGARERIKKALRVMLIAWVAARMRRAAETMLDEMNV